MDNRAVYVVAPEGGSEAEVDALRRKLNALEGVAAATDRDVRVVTRDEMERLAEAASEPGSEMQVFGAGADAVDAMRRELDAARERSPNLVDSAHAMREAVDRVHAAHASRPDGGQGSSGRTAPKDARKKLKASRKRKRQARKKARARR